MVVCPILNLKTENEIVNRLQVIRIEVIKNIIEEMFSQIKLFRSSAPAKPTIPITVSITVQTAKVCFMLTLKYSLNIQKPTSLKCENIKLPAPVEITINSGEIFVPLINGNAIAAAVIHATVAEPVARRKSAAIHHARMSGEKCKPVEICLIYSPVPLSMSTCLKAPPEAIIKSIMATLPTGSTKFFITSFIFFCCFIPRK